MRAWAWVAVFAMLSAGLSGCLSASGSQGRGQGTPPESPGKKPTEPPGQEKKDTEGGFSDTSVFPGEFRMKTDRGTYSLVANPGPLATGKDNVKVLKSSHPGPAEDADIQVGYILPEGATTTEFPVIVVVTPYLNDLETGPLRTRYNSNPKQTLPFLIDNFVPHGYAVAIVPARGTAGNGGCYEWWGPRETADVAKAVDWIISEPWSGNLGFFGLSLGGAGAWMAAGLGRPEVKTIVPSQSEPDLYSWFVRNGTPTIVATPGGTQAYWGIYSVSPFTVDREPSRDPSKIPGSVLCPELANAFGASGTMATTGFRDSLGYAAARDLRPAVEAKYKGSVLLLHGFNDFLAFPHLVHPWVNTLEDRGNVVKQILGQWRHRLPDDPNEGPFFQPTLRPDFAEILLHWFDYWLKGDTTVDLGPRVQVADTQNAWRNEDAWPPRDASPVKWYPKPDGALGTTEGPDGAKTLAPDARRSLTRVNATYTPQQNCPGCAYFETPSFPTETRFAGLATLRVSATPLGPGGYLAATLYAKQGGKYQPLTNAVMDLRFAQGAGAAYVTPNAPVTANLEFEPNDVVLPAGTTLLLELGQYGYGDDAGLFIGEDGSSPAVPSNKAVAPAAYYRNPLYSNPVNVNLGGAKTYLSLPTIERGAEAFFTAPLPTK
ncbi:MAG: CocE/NonD family hydrolase [Euryarchaeota archaeon]|nr:CocE/NonD family hydrolase [Euryarchaeota archaeon]